MKWKLRYSILFLLGVCKVVVAQPDDYRFAHLTVADGLCDNQIKSVLKDSKGFIWIGTQSGLNRYDANRFITYKREPFDTTSLVENIVDALHEDKEGNIWIHTQSSGFCIFDTRFEKFIRNFSLTFGSSKIILSELVEVDFSDKLFNWYITSNNGIIKYNTKSKSYQHLLHVASDSSSIDKSPVTDIKQDVDGSYWIVHRNGVLEKLDPINNKVIFRTYLLSEKYSQLDFFFRLFYDSQEQLWIYTNGTALGIACYKPKTDKINFFNTQNKDFPMNSDLVSSIVEDNQGKIWIGTDHGGINVLDLNSKTIRYITNDRENSGSISQNSITCLYKDYQGIIWAGTYKQGLNYYHEKLYKFRLYTSKPSDKRSLRFNDVNCFCEDKNRNLLIGTNGGGLILFDRKQNNFTGIKYPSSTIRGTGTEIIVSLFKDSENTIWIGTFYGGLIRYDGKNFKQYLHNTDNPASIADNRVWEIFEDSRGNLWVGTLGGGLDLFDREKEIFYHYRGSDKTMIPSDFIVSICEDRAKNIWFGSDQGIFIMDWTTGDVKHLFHSEKDKKSLSNNFVSYVYHDASNRIWVGTRDGLNLYEPETNSFLKFRMENGLPDNAIQAIVEGNKKSLWMSTLNGVAKLTIQTDLQGNTTGYNIVNYDENDGLQGRGFNESSAFKTSSGEIIFGGPNGFNFFLPEEVGQVDLNPPVYLVGIELKGEPLTIKPQISTRRAILKESIISTREIVLRYNENVISFEFAALAFLDAEKIKYRYKLEGFNNEWLKADFSDRKVTYTNLDPGEYIFKVQTLQGDNDESVNEAKLSILVKPPIWKTKAALIFYFLFLTFILLLFRQFLVEKERLKFQREQAVLETQRQQEINSLKTRFFTNISHEFRTPLTLILTPLDRLINKNEQSESQTTLKLIYQNAKRLLYLVNQLLDFRKMEEQRITVNLDYGDIIKFIDEVFHSFADLAEAKKIIFTNKSFVDQLFMRFDNDKLEKILFNLLSNAFKYTHEGEYIGIETEFLPCDSPDSPIKGQPETLVIKVKDTGIGIPTEKHQKIFERFFQDDQPSVILSKGSGIGLSLTQEFVKLHGGIISLESEVDKGSCFTVYLPINRERIEPVKKVAGKMSELEISEAFDQKPDTNPSHFTILLVEDNEDFRFYLRDNLKTQYTILEAANGKDALLTASQELPDLIVSDLVMPVMDGLKLCTKIKQDRKLSHIPFILLTASLTEEKRLEGFNAGADAYITKPFSFELLESRIRNLIAQRERNRKTYQENFKIEPGSIGITPLDEKLMKKALKLVEDNINDTDFSVEKLSQELGFSRVHLYKKVLSITGKSPVEFIRLVRLKRAGQLLRESQLTVSEIAYQVGFNDPRYFSKQFKLEFKMLPSKYKSEHTSKSTDPKKDYF